MKFTTGCCIIAIIWGMTLAPVPGLAADTINDHDALQEVRHTKSLFDINVKTPSNLALYLSVIQTTYDDLVRQGQKPEFVVAFRGPSVRLITSKNDGFADEDQKNLEQAAARIESLQKKGVKFEVCSIATGLLQVDHTTLLPGVKVVGNTFVSLIGYQAKGFALVPIQ